MPDIDVYAAVVALAIVMTLLLQALPAAWLAGRLGLLDGAAASEAAAEPRVPVALIGALPGTTQAARRASGSGTSGPGPSCAALRSP